MLVCVRFRDACRRPEFWMPVVRDYLHKHCPPRFAGIIPHVNPFFRFPSHMARCPDWEWWRFLQWLLPGPKFGTIEFYSVDGMRRIGITTHWKGREGDMMGFEEEDVALPTQWDTFWLYESKEKATSVCCIKSDVQSYAYVRYLTYVDAQLVWRDGPLAGGRRWCGEVTRDVHYHVTPIEGKGFYCE